MGMIQIDEEKISQAVAKKILDAVSSIHYGAVEVVVHNSKVVRLELKEKIIVEEHDSSHKKT